MRFEQWSVFLGMVTLVAGGIVMMPEEFPDDNAYIDDYAVNALLSVEESKVVALLERIESKLGTLQENEKDEFVKKISIYQDRFASTLAKVETIPGMFGLNVAMLRANLGISATEEHVVEIQDDFDDVFSGNNIPEAAIEDESGADYLEKVTDELAYMARGAIHPGNPNLKVSTKPKKTLDDLYNVMTQLVNLVMVQIVQASNKPEPPSHIFPPPPGLALPQASYMYANPTPAPRSRIPKPPKAPWNKKQSPWKPVNKIPNPSPYYNHLHSLFSAIPPVYDDVIMNSDKKKRKRRQAPTGGSAADAAGYQEWYTNAYMPWYWNYQYQMQQYQQALQAYEAAKLMASVPSNPFGNSRRSNNFNGLSNSFHTLSKQSYNDYLYNQVAGTDPTATHAAAFAAAKAAHALVSAERDCESQSTRLINPPVIDDGQPCWIGPSPPRHNGFCGEMAWAGTSLAGTTGVCNGALP